ncbi:hypothetical protein [Jiella pacifica]|uniref:Uncharacterized protein n=1 Tax=Jiella pacifica TaxID=2696469 RepID=A0A6N9T8T5_9HYPH|nr:hypothetical protein [Jiella pacifica]NDW07833.1 hypothetical protein [Jiella pacifica]
MKIQNENIRKYAMHTRDFYVNLGLRERDARILGIFLEDYAPQENRKSVTLDEARNMFACSIFNGRPAAILSKKTQISETVDFFVFIAETTRAVQNNPAFDVEREFHSRYVGDRETMSKMMAARIEELPVYLRTQECKETYRTKNYVLLIGENILP